MPLKVNVKKFSRSKQVQEEEPKNEILEVPQETENIPEPENVYIHDTESEQNIIVTNNDNNDDFLNDLNNENYVEPLSQSELKEQQKLQKEMKKQHDKDQKEYLKHINTKQQKEVKFNNILESNNDLFSDIPTEIIGKEKRELINKITQYKSLFPKELAKFRVKKNCNPEELKAYLKKQNLLWNAPL